MYEMIKNAINEKNSKFAEAMVSAFNMPGLLSESEFALLFDENKCKELFNSNYAILIRIDTSKDFNSQIYFSGKNRYYSGVKKILGINCAVTSEWYGFSDTIASHNRDNRKPLYNWVMEKLEKYDKNYSDWWPSAEEYLLKLSKEDWKKYIFEREISSKYNSMKMFKAMMELNGEASCKQLADTYGGHPSVYVGCATSIGRRVKQYFNLPPCIDEGQERYFIFPFLGKRNTGTEDTYIYRIRPELLDALKEIDLTEINPYYTENNKRFGKFYSWEVIDEKTAIKYCDDSFFKYNQSGIPQEISWFFDASDFNQGEKKNITIKFLELNFEACVSNDSTNVKRLDISWNKNLYNAMQGLIESLKLNKVKAVFKKLQQDVFELSIEGEKSKMSIKDLIENAKSYIASKGFNYDGNLIENFYLSLKSKPFVILAGTSGTGKTKLVKLFAEAIGAKTKLVPVRPDWSDSSDLFGHVDLAGNFKPGAIIDFIKEAQENPNTPYFLCLDEMNLARVEYYLSDFLSIIETRDRGENGDIITDSIVGEEYYQNEQAKKHYGKLILPQNLYVVGTVNMDETTFAFSKKVLDRANTIEFSYVDLMPKSINTQNVQVMQVDNSLLLTKYLFLNEIHDSQYVEQICYELKGFNDILAKANLHVGYRVRDEIAFYMVNNKESSLLSEDEAFDNEIMQKILPRIQGSSMAIKNVLCDLFIKCAGNYNDMSGSTDFEKMESYLSMVDKCKYLNSAKKIAFMVRRYEEDGFTSYWL